MTAPLLLVESNSLATPNLRITHEAWSVGLGWGSQLTSGEGPTLQTPLGSVYVKAKTRSILGITWLETSCVQISRRTPGAAQNVTGTVSGLPAAAGLCWEVPQLSEEQEAGDEALPDVKARSGAWRFGRRVHLRPLAELESEQGGYCYKSGASGWTCEIFGLLSGWWQQDLHYGNCPHEEAG